MEQEEKAITVSIVIPVYAVSTYIERCVNSVINQTYSPIECLLVDDATPDDSISKCERLIADYKGSTRFVILHHDRNRGLSASRNTGLDAATGDYVFYLDSDDELKPDCIEKMVRPIKSNPAIEMVLGNHEVYIQLNSGSPTKKRQTHLPEGDYDTMEKVWKLYKKGGGFDGHAWNKLIKKGFPAAAPALFQGGGNVGGHDLEFHHRTTPQPPARHPGHHPFVLYPSRIHYDGDQRKREGAPSGNRV